DVFISNVTITGSSGNAGQGAIGLKNFFGTLSLINDTIFKNGAIGILETNNGTITVVNTIVDNNTGGDCSGTISTLGNNIEGGTSCNFTGAGDQQNVTVGALNLSGLGPIDLNLSQLGFTPQFPSAAIDKGNNAICSASPINNTDQG